MQVPVHKRAARVVAAAIVGVLNYWTLEFCLSIARFSSPIEWAYVVLSPISIFGWTVCLAAVVAAYFLIGRIAWFERHGSSLRGLSYRVMFKLYSENAEREVEVREFSNGQTYLVERDRIEGDAFEDRHSGRMVGPFASPEEAEKFIVATPWFCGRDAQRSPFHPSFPLGMSGTGREYRGCPNGKFPARCWCL